LQAAVSRQREFLADASAVKFARHVEGLGGALRKIADQQVRSIKGLATAHAASLSHLLLSDQTLAGAGWREWLATHPTLTERLTRLYGRSFAADEVLLAADRVALEAEVEAAPHAAPASTFVPAAKPSAPMPLDDAGEAARHDALQRPEHFDAAERERDALRRVEQWYGLGEWQAAMLALAIDPRARDAAARWRGYAAATGDLHVANAVREEVQALGPGARFDVMLKLLERARQAPPLQRQRLLHEWKQRRRHPALAGWNAAADQWRAIVIRHAFAAPSKSAPSPAAARGTLGTQADAVRAATRGMSRLLADDAAAQTRWHDNAIAALESIGLPPRRGPGGGLAPLTLRADRRELHAALRVRRLSAMQRPLLLRAWTDACRACPPTPASFQDALRFAAAVLDLPRVTPQPEAA
jgi:Peptidase family M48